MLTPVCYSVHRGVPGSWGIRSWGTRGLVPVGLVPGGLVGGGAWSGGSSPGCAWWRPPRWLLLQAVRILLECILVLALFSVPGLGITSVHALIQEASDCVYSSTVSNKKAFQSTCQKGCPKCTSLSRSGRVLCSSEEG